MWAEAGKEWQRRERGLRETARGLHPEIAEDWAQLHSEVSIMASDSYEVVCQSACVVRRSATGVRLPVRRSPTSHIWRMHSLDKDCADFCRTAARFYVAGLALYPMKSAASVEICEACAVECESTTHDHCQRCARCASRQCGDECQRDGIHVRRASRRMGLRLLRPARAKQTSASGCRRGPWCWPRGSLPIALGKRNGGAEADQLVTELLHVATSNARLIRCDGPSLDLAARIRPPRLARFQQRIAVVDHAHQHAQARALRGTTRPVSASSRCAARRNTVLDGRRDGGLLAIRELSRRKRLVESRRCRSGSGHAADSTRRPADIDHNSYCTRMLRFLAGNARRPMDPRPVPPRPRARQDELLQ